MPDAFTSHPEDTAVSEIQTYCNFMTEVRQRLGVIQAVLAGGVRTGHETFDAELIFIQLRKTLELIAFGSLCANKKEYSKVHQNFANHWKAAKMLDALEKVNPDFYPVALDPPQEMADGSRQFSRRSDGVLTRDEFVSLYDSCAEVLHSRNLFRTGRDHAHRLQRGAMGGSHPAASYVAFDALGERRGVVGENSN